VELQFLGREPSKIRPSFRFSFFLSPQPPAPCSLRSLDSPRAVGARLVGQFLPVFSPSLSLPLGRVVLGVPPFSFWGAHVETFFCGTSGEEGGLLVVREPNSPAPSSNGNLWGGGGPRHARHRFPPLLRRCPLLSTCLAPFDSSYPLTVPRGVYAGTGGGGALSPFRFFFSPPLSPGVSSASVLPPRPRGLFPCPVSPFLPGPGVAGPVL